MKKMITIILSFFIMLILSGCSQTSEKKIVIGGANYTEQEIMVEITKQLIEGNSDIKVDGKPHLGGTGIIDTALSSGEIDIAVEYTGSGLLFILKLPLETDPDKAFEIVKSEYDKRKNITWLDPIGFNNTYALAMRKEHAVALNIEKISDLKAHARELSLAGSHEFIIRPDGYPGVQKIYGLSFKKAISMDPGLMYTAVKSSNVDVISAFSTDGRIPAFNLQLLEDDQKFFPPYYASPIIRNETLKKYPELKDILNKLSHKISNEKMAQLNAQVDIDGKTAKEVAHNWLKENELIK